MPDPALYLAFILTATLLVVIPGPNVAVIVANSLAHGRRRGLITVVGTSSAMVLQLSITVIGALTLLATLASWFEALRWIGVAYLIYLGVGSLTNRELDPSVSAKPKTAAEAFMGGFLVSLTNPKTLLFYAAFLPQFVSPEAEPTFQLLILSITFLLIAIVLDSMWALMAARLGKLAHGRARFVHKATGTLLIVAGIGLAMARKL
ncbi:MAG TPA: LysE family translocator [Aestuariivirgaceae bacterium]|jgi:threonine/homoserine/homoserine lactone efflux protein